MLGVSLAYETISYSNKANLSRQSSPHHSLMNYNELINLSSLLHCIYWLSFPGGMSGYNICPGKNGYGNAFSLSNQETEQKSADVGYAF